MATFDPTPRPGDDFNPYETPRAPIGRPQWAMEKAEGSALPFEVGAIFARTWEIFKEQWGLCVGSYLASWFLMVIVQYLPFILAALVGGVAGAAVSVSGPNGAPGLNDAAQTQVVITVFVILGASIPAAFLFLVWILAGVFLLNLKIAQGRDASFADIFRGGRYLFRFLVVSVLVGFLALMALMIGAAPAAIAESTGAIQDPQASLALAVVGNLMSFGAMVLVWIRLSQDYFLIVDRDAGSIESLRTSATITRGRVLGLVGLGLASILINAVGVLMCGVGVFATFPFTLLLFAVSYQALVGGPVSDPYGTGKPLLTHDPLFDP